MGAIYCQRSSCLFSLSTFMLDPCYSQKPLLTGADSERPTYLCNLEKIPSFFNLFDRHLLKNMAEFRSVQRDHNMFDPQLVSPSHSKRMAQKSVFRPPNSRTFYRTCSFLFPFRSKTRKRHRIFYIDIHKLALLTPFANLFESLVYHIQRKHTMQFDCINCRCLSARTAMTCEHKIRPDLTAAC
jgi:hypothetical protein